MGNIVENCGLASSSSLRVGVDVRAFSREHGYDLVPAEAFSAEELASIGVGTFAHLQIV